jgi:hypothetical protein
VLEPLPEQSCFASSFFSYFLSSFRHFFSLEQESQIIDHQMNFLLAILKSLILGAFAESILGKSCKQNLYPG